MKLYKIKFMVEKKDIGLITDILHSPPLNSHFLAEMDDIQNVVSLA